MQQYPNPEAVEALRVASDVMVAYERNLQVDDVIQLCIRDARTASDLWPLDSLTRAGHLLLHIFPGSRVAFSCHVCTLGGSALSFYLCDGQKPREELVDRLRSQTTLFEGEGLAQTIVGDPGYQQFADYLIVE